MGSVLRFAGVDLEVGECGELLPLTLAMLRLKDATESRKHRCDQIKLVLPFACVCVCVCVGVVSVCVCMCVYACVSVCVCMCVYSFLYVCMYVCMYICMYELILRDYYEVFKT